MLEIEFISVSNFSLKDVFTLFGLLLTLLGASLLFFYGLPRKKVGNVIIQGDMVFKFKADGNEKDIPNNEWQPVVNRFLKRSKILNSLGFALVALGTLFQFFSIFIAIPNV